MRAPRISDPHSPARRRALAAWLSVLTLASSLPAAGCAGTRYGAGAGGITTATANSGWRTRKVVEKKPTETLVADDGTICRVAPDRFTVTTVGSLVPCNWQ